MTRATTKDNRDTKHALLRDRFLVLYHKLQSRNDFFEAGRVKVPPLGRPNLPKLRRKILAGSKTLPAYHDTYFDPLLSNLEALTKRLVILGHPQAAALYFFLTTLVNAAIQLGPTSRVAVDICRLRAVISDIFTSYLYSEPRMKMVGSPAHKRLPPLGAFVAPHPVFPEYPQPYMLAPDQLADLMKGLCKQFGIGAVSLPSGYRNHPILWGVLAHEIGGHDVLHADDNLVCELQTEVRNLFDGKWPKYLGPLWSHWCEEAASDVCGLLNIGPAYGIGAVIYHTVIAPLAKKKMYKRPELDHVLTTDYYRTQAERHPVAVVIPDLLIGATEQLDGLTPKAKVRYITQLEELAEFCIRATAVQVSEGVVLPGYDEQLPKELPLDVLRASARKVGSHIARVGLPSLKNNCLIDIETWDQPDEEAAQRVAKKLQARQSLNKDGADDAQLLAGAIFAIFRNPELYDSVSNALRRAFHQSYKEDLLLSRGPVQQC